MDLSGLVSDQWFANSAREGYFGSFRLFVMFRTPVISCVKVDSSDQNALARPDVLNVKRAAARIHQEVA